MLTKMRRKRNFHSLLGGVLTSIADMEMGVEASQKKNKKENYCMFTLDIHPKDSMPYCKDTYMSMCLLLLCSQ